MNREKFIGLNITTGKYADFVKKIIQMAGIRQSSYVCVANVHMLVEAHIHKSFQDIVNNAQVVTPDGKPLAIGLRVIYGIKQDRVAGMDLLPDLLREAETNHISVFIYGGTPEMLSKTSKYLKDNYPNLTVSGIYSPPFRLLSVEEQEEIVSIINNSNANLVFVALGCPKQETWMATMQGKINSTMIGIGGALPVLIGMQKRAPMWLQKLSLEWLYRLVQEPQRLFKRYLYTNSYFCVLLFIELFKKKFFKGTGLERPIENV